MSTVPAKVYVWSKTNCVECRKTKALLEKLEVEYIEMDVATYPNTEEFKQAPIVTVVGPADIYKDDGIFTQTSWSGHNPGYVEMAATDIEMLKRIYDHYQEYRDVDQALQDAWETE